MGALVGMPSRYLCSPLIHNLSVGKANSSSPPYVADSDRIVIG